MKIKKGRKYKCVWKKKKARNIMRKRKGKGRRDVIIWTREKKYFKPQNIINFGSELN